MLLLKNMEELIKLKIRVSSSHLSTSIFRLQTFLIIAKKYSEMNSLDGFQRKGTTIKVKFEFFVPFSFSLVTATFLSQTKPAFIQFISTDANFSAHETNARLIVFNHTQFSTVFFQLREHLIRLFS